MLQKTRVRDDPTRPDHDLRPGSWLLWHGKSLWCRHCFASRIAAAEAERAMDMKLTSQSESVAFVI